LSPTRRKGETFKKRSSEWSAINGDEGMTKEYCSFSIISYAQLVKEWHDSLEFISHQ